MNEDFEFWCREKCAADGHEEYYEPGDLNRALTKGIIERLKA